LRLSSTKTTASTCVYDGTRMYYDTSPSRTKIRPAGACEHRIPPAEPTLPTSVRP